MAPGRCVRRCLCAIYSIPPTCPLYNVTYVRVYGSTLNAAVVGYTDGYFGQYVAASGAVMFGAGLATATQVSNNAWCFCGPGYYSYGCDARYDNAMESYLKIAAAQYGPSGGAGWRSQFQFQN